MPRRKKHKHEPNSAVIKNSVYAVKGAKNTNPPKKAMFKSNAKQTKQARVAIENAQRMAKIEAYAKEHKITVTQAMIHFM
ncbi:hypothetical protein R0J87_15520 [Halomonas sp. SIMBA_159]|tara:strand:- start:5191 stop:5430 length:240 start_codon:yes stop_codon:yes gene_type:complete